MSVNFGYGSYGMMNNMGIMNNMQANQGGICQSISSQYNCPTCYQYGVVPYNYQSCVNPIPQHVKTPTFISRIVRKFFGG